MIPVAAGFRVFSSSQLNCNLPFLTDSFQLICNFSPCENRGERRGRGAVTASWELNAEREREVCDWFNRCFSSHSLSLALSLCLSLTLTQQIQLCPDRVTISLNFCYVMQSGRTKRFGIFHYAHRALDWNKGRPLSMPEREREGERGRKRESEWLNWQTFS